MEKPGTHTLQVLLLTALRNAPAWEEQQWMSAASQAHRSAFRSSDSIRKIHFTGEVISKECSNLWITKKKTPAKVNFPALSVGKSGCCISLQHCLQSFWYCILKFYFSLCAAADISVATMALLCRTYKCKETSS